jgi:hypothetical protein
VVCCHAQYRKKPLAQLEHGSRIYAPSASEAPDRVVATDPVSGERILAKCRTEDQARAKARELEQLIAQAAPIRDPHDTGPRSVERLAGRYIEGSVCGSPSRPMLCARSSRAFWRAGQVAAASWTPWRLATRPAARLSRSSFGCGQLRDVVEGHPAVTR